MKTAKTYCRSNVSLHLGSSRVKSSRHNGQVVVWRCSQQLPWDGLLVVERLLYCRRHHIVRRGFISVLSIIIGLCFALCVHLTPLCCYKQALGWQQSTTNIIFCAAFYFYFRLQSSSCSAVGCIVVKHQTRAWTILSKFHVGLTVPWRTKVKYVEHKIRLFIDVLDIYNHNNAVMGAIEWNYDQSTLHNGCHSLKRNCKHLIQFLLTNVAKRCRQ